MALPKIIARMKKRFHKFISIIIFIVTVFGALGQTSCIIL